MHALNNINLEIPAGMYGLLGPNGAGKSSLMRTIACLQKPDSGSIFLDELDLLNNPVSLRKMLGYLPQDYGLDPGVSAKDMLTHLAILKGIGDAKQRKQRVDELLHHVNLHEARNKKLGTFSGGMKQRVGIAQTLLNDPKIVIFDEPTVGLDPEERVRFRNLISDLANDCVVILSSHIVSDIDTIADQVAIMKDGKLITHGYQDTVIDTVANNVYEVSIKKEALSTFKSHHIIVSTTRKKENLIVRYIAENPVNNSIKVTSNLEDAYLYLTKTN